MGSKYLVFRTLTDADEVLALVSAGWEYKIVVDQDSRQPKKKAERVRRRRRRRTPFTQDERIEMVRLHKSGLQTRIIAKRMGASTSGAYHAIVKTKKELGLDEN